MTDFLFPQSANAFCKEERQLSLSICQLPRTQLHYIKG